MQRLTLELPDRLLSDLKERATRQQRQVEDLIVEELSNGVGHRAQTPEECVDRFYAESELFERPTEEEQQRYRPLTEGELGEIGRKLIATGPLSDAIIEDRRLGH